MFSGFIKNATINPVSKISENNRNDRSFGTNIPEKKWTKHLKIILRPLILGSIDGIITSFVIISGGIAGEVTKKSILIIGFSSLFADAFSMGTSEYLSSRTEHNAYRSFAHGISCFLSFIFFGLIPLITYILSGKYKLITCIVSYILSLIMIGLFQSLIVRQIKITYFLEIFLLGIIAGGISYVIAHASHRIGDS